MIHVMHSYLLYSAHFYENHFCPHQTLWLAIQYIFIDIEPIYAIPCCSKYKYPPVPARYYFIFYFFRQSMAKAKGFNMMAQILLKFMLKGV